MKTRSLHWTIETVVRRKLRINPQPQYQRTPVWSEAKRQLLIDSILRQYDMPKFYLRESNPPYDHEVVDGQQRLRAIWDFYEGRYVLGDTSKDIPDFGDLSGKKFSELPSDTQDRIGLFDLNLVEVEDASDLEIRDLFLRSCLKTLNVAAYLNQAYSSSHIQVSPQNLNRKACMMSTPSMPICHRSNRCDNGSGSNRCCRHRRWRPERSGSAPARSPPDSSMAFCI